MLLSPLTKAERDFPGGENPLSNVSADANHVKGDSRKWGNEVCFPLVNDCYYFWTLTNFLDCQ